jgi:hypothetical protein
MTTEYNSKVERFKQLTGEMCALYARKNKDYGDSFTEMYKEWGAMYPMSRMQEKLRRATQILRSGEAQVKEEKVTDTLLDLANYALMTIMEIKEGNGDNK